jgi:hypothetical protein
LRNKSKVADLIANKEARDVIDEASRRSPLGEILDRGGVPDRTSSFSGMRVVILRRPSVAGYCAAKVVKKSTRSISSGATRPQRGAPSYCRADERRQRQIVA